MPTINDNSFNQLKSVTDGLQPLKNKLDSGDLNLSGDDVQRFNAAFDTWRSTLDSNS